MIKSCSKWRPLMRTLRITAGRHRQCINVVLSFGGFTSAPDECKALVVHRRAVGACDRHAAVAIDDAVAGWAGALVPRPGADHFVAVASARVAADRLGNALPTRAVTNIRAHERVRDFV